MSSIEQQRWPVLLGRSRAAQMLDAQLKGTRADFQEVAELAMITRAFPIGSTVRLLVQIGGFAAGTEGVVVSADGDTYEIEIEPDRSIIIDMDPIRTSRNGGAILIEPGEAFSDSPDEAAS